ncbi:MAG: DNA pilot protein [Microviridae sp.]|nr:MAG: DNA pilot protein [Microviridae sp.]
MGLLSSIGKALKSVAKVALPVAAAYYGGPLLSQSGLLGTGDLSLAAANGFGIGDAIGSVAGSNLFSGLVSSGLGGYASYQGTQQTNAQQIALSQKQMDFQERMSNTQWQRGVSDMKSAGLNPMLAYSQGGASSPMGSMPVVSNPTASAINTAMAIKSQSANLDNVNADTALKQATAVKTAQDTTTSATQATNLESQGALYRAQTEKVVTDIAHEVSQIDLNTASTAEVYKKIDALQSQMGLNQAYVDKIKAEIPNILESTKNLSADRALTVIKTKLEELALPHAQVEAGIYGGPGGRGVALGEKGVLPNVMGTTIGVGNSLMNLYHSIFGNSASSVSH